MRRHWNRTVYYFIGDERPIVEPAYLTSGDTLAETEKMEETEEKVYLLFGRLFDRHDPKDAAEEAAMVQKLIALGKLMTDPQGQAPPPPDDSAGDSDIPAGYTYLGQFITHEITFHNTLDLSLTSQPLPSNARSPQFDLDSLYGSQIGAQRDLRLYEADGVRLRVGETTRVPGAWRYYPNDLPRQPSNSAHPGAALIADPRNDENLALAQTHLAFIHFHNHVVERLAYEGYQNDELFEYARKLVVQHFQWLILEDYLPRILDRSVLRCAREHPPFSYQGADTFMPIEFSAAAFRVGHSMVRGSYQLNTFRSDQPFRDGKAGIDQLFRFTEFSGNLGRKPVIPGLPTPTTLPSSWVIDWRRFYDFDQLRPDRVLPMKYRNTARKLDTLFSLRLQNIPNYPHGTLKPELLAITVRNLLRGYSFGLPSGEQVAERLGVNELTPEEVRRGPHEAVLKDPAFRRRTPLWYYVLKEAELNGGRRLGAVGSRIVAETFVELIRRSPYSILKKEAPDAPDWEPVSWLRRPGEGRARFEMADLINFAQVVDPIGDFLGEL